MPGRLRLRAAASTDRRRQALQTVAAGPLSGRFKESVMTGPLVTLEVSDGVGVLLLNRPPVNALNEQLREQLVDRSSEAQGRADVRAVVVAGAGKHFAAGADISELEGTSLAEMAGALYRLQSSLGALARIEKPTVAA